VLADGFSCKTQIEQATAHRPLHLAQFLQLAKHGEWRSGDIARDGFGNNASDASRKRNGALLLGGVAVAFGAFYLARRVFR
jgi:hypothetical protein